MSALYYLYGITDQASVSPSHLHTIQSRSLYGVYEEVGEEFSDDRFRDNLQDQQWLIEKAEKHQNTLDQLFKEVPIIPIAFGSIFQDVAAISEKISNSSEQYSKVLALIKGKQELGIKLFYKKATVTEYISAKHKATEDLRNQIAESGAGKAFILKKELEEQTKKLIKEALNEERKSLYDELNSATSHLKMIENSKPELQQNKDANILNLALLATEEETSNIHKIVDTYNQANKEAGLYATITGPWPAYNFVNA